MQLKNAAALIYTKTKYVGFRQGFVVQPEGFPPKLAEKLVEYVRDSLDGIAELRSLHKHSMIIIAEGNYILLGVAVYLRDLVKDGWTAQDKGNRPVQGFLAYVFHRDSFTIPVEFPDLTTFTPLLEEWIRPHWEDSENSRWAETLQISDFSYSFDTALLAEDSMYSPARFRDRVVIEGEDKERQLVNWAIREVINGCNISVCTNVCVYSACDLETKFQYIAELKQENQVKQTAQKTPVKQERQIRPAAQVTQPQANQARQEHHISSPVMTQEPLKETYKDRTSSSGHIRPGILIIIGIVVVALIDIICFKLFGSPVCIGFLVIAVLVALGVFIFAVKKNTEAVNANPAKELEQQNIGNKKETQEKTQKGIQEKAQEEKEDTEDLFKL